MADDEETVSDAMSLCGDCGDPAVAFMEVYSLPRIAPAVCRLGLKVGPSLDLENGWDFRVVQRQGEAVRRVQELQPLVLMLSPPCTVFSQVQHTMLDRRDLDKWAARYAEGLCLWKFACRLFKLQVLAGRYAVLEQPWLATSWKLPSAEKLRHLPGVRDYVFDQCLHGLCTTVEKNPVRNTKPGCFQTGPSLPTTSTRGAML